MWVCGGSAYSLPGSLDDPGGVSLQSGGFDAMEVTQWQDHFYMFRSILFMRFRHVSFTMLED